MSTGTSYRVWDLPTRLFHWCLVALIALQWASGEFELLSMKWHFWLGYATLALLLFRIVWGFVGSESARFSHFLRGPRATLVYGRALLRGEAPDRAGHNPLGAWSVLAMLLCVALQAVTGLFATDEIVWSGPLADAVSARTADWLTDIHESNQYVLLGLIGLHLAAVLWHQFARREDLLGGMLRGSRALPQDPALRFVRPWSALIVLALAAAAVAWAIGAL